MEREFGINADWRGFELHPETPKGGVEISAFLLEGRVQRAREHMKTFAASFGIYGMKSPGRLPNSRRALAIAEFARDRSKLGAFRTLAMEARWKKGEDLEDDGVLRGIATASGLDPGEAIESADLPEYLGRVDSMRAEAGSLGVHAIPTFIIGEERVVGCQPYQVLAGAALRARGHAV